MTTKIKDIDKLLNTTLKEFEKQLGATVKDAQVNFEKELGTQVAEIVKEITSTLGNGSLADGVNAGIASVASGLISGQGVDARDVANSVASSLVPEVEDFFRQSSSQIADDFSGFLGLGSRNN